MMDFDGEGDGQVDEVKVMMVNGEYGGGDSYGETPVLSLLKFCPSFPLISKQIVKLKHIEKTKAHIPHCGSFNMTKGPDYLL